jgi:hypothetical protein
MKTRNYEINNKSQLLLKSLLEINESFDKLSITKFLSSFDKYEGALRAVHRCEGLTQALKIRKDL